MSVSSQVLVQWKHKFSQTFTNIITVYMKTSHAFLLYNIFAHYFYFNYMHCALQWSTL